MNLWSEVNSGCSIILVIIIYAIAVLLILFLPANGNPLTTCLFRTRHPWWLKYTQYCRGDNYFMVGRHKYDEIRRTGVITTWAVLHLCLYIILGFLCPQFFWQLFMISVIWEGKEMLIDRCQCWLDLCWNLAGLTFGYYLRCHYNTL